MLSVIVPIYNEEKYIAKCIDSILEQDFPKDELEIILADGMSQDCTREIVAKYTAKYPFISLIDNPKRIAPWAMNLAVKEAKGDVIMRLDAHAIYEKNYFSALVRALKVYDADNVGAVCRTDVLNKTPKTLAIREVLSNKFGVGNSTFRTGISGVQEVETVPFGCWKREVFEKYGMYDVRLVRNQDIELNKRIIRGGGRIVIVPDTYCTYFARENYHELAKNNYGNGKWNILTVYYTKEMRSLSVRHFVPLAFVLSLIVPILVGVFWWPTLCVSVLALCVYLLALGSVSAKLAVSKRLSFFYLLASFSVLHISYGWGSLVGILKLLFTK
ncbi:glycosyltransferase family 2 protein [Bacteroides faecis]|uniref:glycosyltransferase family 2 protein n=1 Tax=Bacteroides faecis TaxID=674529 RepID=UPI000E441BA0|nr:glycosyltransferase family 2 protein [Bacteroides faecis]MCS2481819.1 glycosyltransferase family 2 protein [Bacteroides faecis]RGO29583.1 glycosyltransferase family 2 protein [Bacteroides faecis]